MKKKTLVWRLKEQPTAEKLQGLVYSGILTKDEAREILFNLQIEDERSIEGLKSEIKFLRELVENLSNTSKVVEIIREIEKPYRRYDWCKPYINWCDNTTVWSSTSNTVDSSVDTTALNSTAISNCLFSDITTF